MIDAPHFKYLYKAARACPTCGVNLAYVLPTGALRCRGCFPTRDETVTQLIARPDENGKLVWQQAGDWGDEEPGGLVAKSHSPDPDRPPTSSACQLAPPSHTRNVYASTKLDWFLIDLGTGWDNLVEVVNDGEVFRRLDTRYFAWLYRQIRQVADEAVQREATNILHEIAIEAVAAGVLPVAFCDRDCWPESVPPWYRGPVVGDPFFVGV